jgi:hypothetical protein
MNTNKFTIDNIEYVMNPETGYCTKTVVYPVEGGKMHRQSTRISKNEFAKAMQEHDDRMDAKMHEAIERLVQEEEDAEVAAIQKEMMKTEKTKKGLTYEELIELAKKHYSKGGDSTVECWDINTYNTYVEQFGPITRKVAMSIFGCDADSRADAEQRTKAPRKKKVRVGGIEFVEDGMGVILTAKQVAFIKELPRTQFWTGGLDSALWIDILCDELSDKMGPMTIGAMVSTLREKHLLVVSVGSYDNGKKAKYIAFTELGKKVVAKVLGL